jgi:hypothetical protein
MLPRRTFHIASPWILVSWKYNHYGKAWPSYGARHLLAADGSLLCGRDAPEGARRLPAGPDEEPSCQTCRMRALIPDRP